MSKLTPQQRIDLLRKLLIERTSQMYGDDDVHQLEMFSQAEWREKGESEASGEGAILTVFIGDSRWCDAVNGYSSEEDEHRAGKTLDKLTAQLGLDWDTGGEDLLHFWFSKER